jgi:phage/plasmid-associated DNA primase
MKLSQPFVGDVNGKTSKKTCPVTTARQMITDLPIPKNGFAYTGSNPEYPEGMALVVVDLDIKDKFDGDITFLEEQTLVVCTGSGGRHIFFWCPSEWKIGNSHNVRITEYAKRIGLKAVDVRGEGGKIFLVGCQFDEHASPYILLSHNQPLAITREGWDKLMETLIDKSPEYPDLPSTPAVSDWIAYPLIITEIAEITTLILKYHLFTAGDRHEPTKKMALAFKFYHIDQPSAEQIVSELIKEDGGDPSDLLRVVDDMYNGTYAMSGSAAWLATTFKKGDLVRFQKIVGKIEARFLKTLAKCEAVKIMKAEGKKEETFVYQRWEAQLAKMSATTPIKFILGLNQWVKYDQTDGRYKDQCPDQIKKLIMDWAEKEHVDTQKYLRHLMERTQVLCGIEESETKHYPYVCMKNCILNINSREIQLHDPKIVFYKQHTSQRNFYPDVKEIPETWKKALDRIDDEFQRQELIQYIINMCHYWLDDESFVVIFGRTRGGKGALLSGLGKIFEGSTSSTQINDLGGRFGMWQMYNKWVNIVKEANGAKWDDASTTKLKAIVGRDGDMEIEGKNVKQFLWFVECFIIIAANYLPKIAINDESFMAVMSRLILIEIKHTVPTIDPAFKTLISSGEIADEMFSWAMNQPVANILPKSAELLDERAKQNWVQWQNNSNPIAKCISGMYECNRSGDDKHPEWRLSCEWVRSAVNSKLEEMFDIPIPEDAVGINLRKQAISEILAHMEITRHGREYWCIKELSASTPPIDVPTPPTPTVSPLIDDSDVDPTLITEFSKVK